MEGDHLSHILQSLIGGKLCPAEDLRKHPLAQVVMVVEGPPPSDKLLRPRLADVVEECSHPEPKGVRSLCHIVHHLDGVVEVVLMPHAILGLRSLQCRHLREVNVHQPGAIHQVEPNGWLAAGHDLHKLPLYPVR